MDKKLKTLIALGLSGFLLAACQGQGQNADKPEAPAVTQSKEAAGEASSDKEATEKTEESQADEEAESQADKASKKDADKDTAQADTPTEAPAPASEMPETQFVDPEDEQTDNFFVTANWLKQEMEKDEDLKVIEGSYGDEGYNKGHIPGAALVDTNDVETLESDWNLLEPEELVKPFLKAGITKDSRVVFYGDDINAACRVAFAAYYLGVKDVKILDGKKEVWEKAGYDLTTDQADVAAAEDFGGAFPERTDEYIKTSEDLLEVKAEKPDLKIASVRSWDEFAGKTSGYDYIDNAGEIKDAVWAMASETAADVNYISNADGSIRDPETVIKEWEKWGITQDTPVTFYCGTGWRNTTVFFMAKQAGFKDVSVQDGGWYEWDMKHQDDPAKFPIQEGIPGTEDFKVEDK